MADYPDLRSAVQDVAIVSGAGFRQAMIDLNLRGADLERLQSYSEQIMHGCGSSPEYGVLGRDAEEDERGVTVIGVRPGEPRRSGRRGPW